MSGWNTYKLGEIAEIIMGQSPFGETCNEDGIGIPLINGPTEFGSHYPIPFQFTIDAKKLCNVDDILFCVRGSTTGKMNWADRQYAIGRGIASIRHKKGKEYKHFLKGLIDNNLKNILGIATGSTFPNVSGEQLREFEVLAPENLPEQKAIASILSSFDDKIELNIQMNQTLETMAQAIFKEWFVNFNFPGFNGELVDGLPKDWRIGKVLDTCKVNANTLSAKDEIEEIRYIEISEVEKGVIKNILLYKRGEEPSRAKRKLIHGDVVLSTVRPNRGSYFLSLYPDSNSIVSTGFAVFTAITVPFSFLYCFLTNEEQIEYYGRMADGAAYPAINPSVIMNIDFVIPSIEVLKSFNDIVENLYLKIYENLKNNQSLVQLRDSLLPKLMTGKIEVNT